MILLLLSACMDMFLPPYNGDSDDVDSADSVEETGNVETGGDDSDTNVDSDSGGVVDTDNDGDGYGAEADCDDNNASVNPGVAEICGNGVDDNCDGESDDGDARYFDGDGDGYGDASIEITTCVEIPSYVVNANDCDDARSDVNPSASEVCDSADNDCDGGVDEGVELTFYEDADGDGQGNASSSTLACSVPEEYVENADDCNDADVGVHLGATEYCDGLDNDCDGSVDEGDAFGAPTWFADNDGDSFGNPGDAVVSCYEPSGYVVDAGDCDDTSAEVNPDAIETCNGLDDDCDGEIDPDSAVGTSTFYLDADSDGYGLARKSETTCTAPSGYVEAKGDCDDGDSTINPGASEVCDSADNDCDGTTDESDATGATTWYYDGDNDGFGDSRDSIENCSAPSGYIAESGDCDDADAAINPDAEEICNGLDDDCDDEVDEGFDADSDGIADCSDVEECDGVDNNGDGVIDEDNVCEVACFPDADNDGYGDSVGGIAAKDGICPEGYVDHNGDCDDSNDSTHPGAYDAPDDAYDDDCDGKF